MTEEEIDRYITEHLWLIRRTGIANARRRQQIVYWNIHATKLSQARTQNGPPIQIHEKSNEKSRGIRLLNPLQLHIFHDLQPYHCTYKDCHDPHRLYGTRQDWVNHESQHSQVWHCRDHNEKFETESGYIDHLRALHPEVDMKGSLLELISIAIEPSLRSSRDCPFCLKDFPEITDKLEGSDYLSDSQKVQHHGRRDSIAKDFEDEEEPFTTATITPQVNEQNRKQDVIENSSNHVSSTENNNSLESWFSGLKKLLDDTPSEGTLSAEDPTKRTAPGETTANYQLETFSRDDQEKAQHIHDQSKEHILPQIYQPITHNITKIHETIEEELDLSQVSSAMDHGKRYIPRDKLQGILTVKRIRAIVTLPFFQDFPNKDDLTRRIYYGSTDSNPLSKLLAVFVGIGKLEDFPKCIEEGIDDGCLPMTADNLSDGKMSLYCEAHKTHHATINKFRRPNHRLQFTQWSYRVIAPCITSTKQEHSHCYLHASDIFPMPSGKKLQKQDTMKQHMTKQDNKPQMTEVAFAYGGFSEVYQVKIGKSHQYFEDIGIRHPEKMFALKKLISHDRNNFNLELSSLLFCMDESIKKKADKHVIQPLATFEVEEPAVDGSTYYILFDWAEGNLNDFWKKNDHLVGVRDHCRWMSREFYSLCLALECVHNERKETLKFIDKTALEKTLSGRPHDANNLYGRHGDIKPDNVLWFDPPQRPPPQQRHSSSKQGPSLPGNLDRLVLSDFGLGRLHTQVSRSNRDPRNIARIETYRAPEFDLNDGKISRASDIFSLGCVFLEYVTWFLLGNEIVTEKFPTHRLESDIYTFESDTFFNIRLDAQSGKQRPFLKESVKFWIEQLQKHEDCSWYLHQPLDIIRDKMLAPDREKRIHIMELIKDMDVLRQTCERNVSFYLKTKSES
ncbi:kinase-like domain-containing protein [Daldinia decipiens]|uniref:kinase-like domain-containing protein n=1 Tax=Daldinia decipiens TaxID=326647 RepID=UPI0020C537E4|nr:kinase-like domain-containing protein [Daldinia decipiens]KAI1654573.1 kinase-like domain-containing protein [Daldinia decipiens]